MARSELREGARGKTAAPVAEPAHDLDNAQRQFEILNPALLHYDLVLAREFTDEKIVAGKKVRETVSDFGKRAITVPIEFTLGDILKRRVKDDLEAFARLTVVEIGRVLPTGMKLSEAFEGASGYVEIGLMKSNVRELLRHLISAIASFDDDHTSPTIEQIADGMAPEDFMVVGVMLMNRAFEDIAKRKNARTAAGA